MNIEIVENKIETNKEKIEKVKLKKELNLWKEKINAEDLITWLPKEWEAIFKDGIWINKKERWEQEITIIIKIWEEIREIQTIIRISRTLTLKENNVAWMWLGMKENQPTIRIDKKLIIRDKNDIIDKTSRYLTGSNFRLQIGKMQEDWWTIYTEEMLRFWIEYMINHTKKWEQSIIQIWSDVWALLQQWSEEWVLSAEDEKKKIEEFIEKNYWKKWECIKVIIWSEQEEYSDLFNELNEAPPWERRFKLMPDKDKEPTLEGLRKYLKDTPKEEITPLPIIQYLTYHAIKNKELFDLFYYTKPPKYIKQDRLDKREPWDTDADFYAIVEVWLRLTEILKWISIQWWVWRQRVYDKIISLIINWEDRIWKNKNIECGPTLQIENYKALEDLHNIIKDLYPDINFSQVYIDITPDQLDKINKKEKESERIRRKTITSIAAAFLLLWWLYGWYKLKSYQDLKEQQQYEQEESDMLEDYENKHENPHYLPLYSIDYLEEESYILTTEYDLHKHDYYTLFGTQENSIADFYKDTFYCHEDWTKERLKAEKFMEHYWRQIIKIFHVPYQKPYQYLKEEKWDFIKNTLNFWKKIDISKCYIEEIPQKKVYRYYIKIPSNYEYSNNEENFHRHYSLKFFRVYLDQSKTKYIDMIFAAKTNRRTWDVVGEYTLENWLLCMNNLHDNYWLDI